MNSELRNQSANSPIVFLGNGRCYHTVDWFRSIQQLRPDQPPIFITDLIDGEGFERLLNEEDCVRRLFTLDPYLFRSQFHLANWWRNILKMLLLPLQAILLRLKLRSLVDPIIHAHSMYYIALARLSGRRYVATPQGSELLKRPFRSKLYYLFARFALNGANLITVDSTAMQKTAHELFGLTCQIVQNGINIKSITATAAAAGGERSVILSPRGFTINYRIAEIIEARNREEANQPLVFCYPFYEQNYKERAQKGLKPTDRDLGRLSRVELYHLMCRALLVISIPSSDSSPRTNYEAIFAGSAVATTYSPWLDTLPACMRSRVIEIDLNSPTWLSDALGRAKSICESSYSPSEHALIEFDQLNSARLFLNEIYPRAALSARLEGGVAASGI